MYYANYQVREESDEKISCITPEKQRIQIKNENGY